MGDRPSRPPTASSTPAPIDVLSQEVEEMEMNEQRQRTMQTEYDHNHPAPGSHQDAVVQQQVGQVPPPRVSCNP